MDNYKLHGFKEVVFSIRNVERDKAIYAELGGWDIIHESELARNQLDFWNLPSEATADTALLKYPGRDSGMLRLIGFNNVKQKHIRDSSQPWDTGGIYDIDVRVADIDKKIEEFQSYGWTGFCEKEEHHFNQFHVAEILLKGTEDMVVALIKRYAPTLEGYPMLKEMSHVFNTSQIVKDMAVAKEFYQDKLGMKIYLENVNENSAPGINLFGIPHNIYPNTRREIIILSPDGGNEGSVELIEIGGLTGRNFKDDCAPPNLGILMLRFPVDNLPAYAARLKEKGVKIINESKSVNIQPYGNAHLISVQSPDGVWMEFYELNA